MAVDIGPRIGIDGEAEFRKQINNLIQQQKTLASEMKAVTSAFDKNDKSQESLTAQAKVLRVLQVTPPMQSATRRVTPATGCSTCSTR